MSWQVSYSTASIMFLVAIIALYSVGICTGATEGPGHNKVVVCYISTWAVYRPDAGKFDIDNFDPALCTHVIYAFAGLDIEQSAIKSLDPWQDLKDNYGKGGYERLTGLKRLYPHLKVSLAIGGWNEGSKNFSNMAANATMRSKFVRQVTTFIRKYNFDGLDLDWEYPTQRDGKPIDRENFLQMVKELHDIFKPLGLLLTSAIGAAKNVIDEAYSIPELSLYLDYFHVMCYDYHGNWDHKVGYNAPLTAPTNDPFSVEYSIDYLLKLGAPPEKIAMGVPFYGRAFKTSFEGNIDDEADSTSFQGPYTRELGFLGYNEICELLSNSSSGWNTMWDPETSQVLSRSEKNTTTGLVKVLCYDNARSIANKVKFAMERKLAGIMAWSIDTDDFRGNCLPEKDTYEDYRYLKSANIELPSPNVNRTYPLLRTINSAISLALEDIKYRHEHAEEVPEIPEDAIDENHRPYNEIDNEIPNDSQSGAKEKSASSSASTVFQSFESLPYCRQYNIVFSVFLLLYVGNLI